MSTATPAPHRYFERVAARATAAQQDPICVYLETTNRCSCCDPSSMAQPLLIVICGRMLRFILAR